jgi:hypothetical protein
VHPNIDPLEISNALGLKAENVRRAGDRRVTPKGKLLEGNYPDLRWRYSVQYNVSDQRFADKIGLLLDCIEPHQAFLKHLHDTGGRSCLVLQFFGYTSDSLSISTLRRIVDLELELGIECYVD